ncbi:hypothetical protein R1sor_010991 [Riccia sorocarpa]|uniref:Uncharacterized protein n=1 Tax=Riccia sorocarpa TaxID=122646 RepID=A0ABD3HZL3_9MARC
MAAVAAPPEVVLTELKEVALGDSKTTDLPDLTCNFRVEYPTEEQAKIVMTTLSVDAELQPDKVARSMTVEGQHLLISFKATEARYLRASVSAFMDMLMLATRTIEEFGQLTLIYSAVGLHYHRCLESLVQGCREMERFDFREMVQDTEEIAPF